VWPGLSVIAVKKSFFTSFFLFNKNRRGFFLFALAREDDIFFNPGWRLLLGIFISSNRRQRHTFECYSMNYHTFNPRNVEYASYSKKRPSEHLGL
jgi:hypothetical protein